MYARTVPQILLTKVSLFCAKPYIFILCNHAQQSIDKRILCRIAWSGENGNKILIECGLSNQFSDIGKGEVRSIVNSVTTLRCFIEVSGIYPSYGYGHHAEIEMVGNGMIVSGLAF